MSRSGCDDRIVSCRYSGDQVLVFGSEDRRSFGSDNVWSILLLIVRYAMMRERNCALNRVQGNTAIVKRRETEYL